MENVTSSKVSVYNVVQSKPPALLKVALLHECFSRFLSYANGTKSHKASRMICFCKIRVLVVDMLRSSLQSYLVRRVFL